MPESVTTPQPGFQMETPSGFFNSALMEIESYFDLPPGEAKPRLVTAPNSPSLNASFRDSPGIWGTGNDSPVFQTFASDLGGLGVDADRAQFQSSGIAPLQTTIEPNMFLGNPSPPDSSDSPPTKYEIRGDISPLDSLIGHGSAESRTIHGQVTPPEDTKSPRLRPVHPSLILPMQLTPPEGSPENSPRLAKSRTHQSMSTSDDSPNSNRKRRSPTPSSSSRKQRRSESNDEPMEVQEAKRKRFLERNRVAASKCRQKKKAWMQDLESEARQAQNLSKQLKLYVGMYKEEILQLKNELLKHNTCECTPIRQYLSNEAIRLADGNGPLGMHKSARPSNASDFIFHMAAPESGPKLDPALSASDFDLEFVDIAEV